MRILHLPGLCFGMADREEEVTVRNCCLEILLWGLEAITKKYPVDYIFITSDLVQDTFLGNNREIAYYLHKISAVCGESLRRIYLCPELYDEDDAEEEAVCLFHIYEIEEKGKRDAYTSTTYKFDGRDWEKRWERVSFNTKDKPEERKRLPRRFSVMWWMKIS